MVRFKNSPFSFILPALIFINIIMIIPLLYSLGTSFTNWVVSIPGSEHDFIGLKNYLMTLKDVYFWKSVNVTLIFSIFSIAGELILGIFFAILLNKKFIGRQIMRSLIIIPMVIPAAAIGMFWKLLYQQNGVFNYFLSASGFKMINWLSNENALISSIIMDIWQWTPFVAVIILAGLQSTSNSTIEAAQVDGANSFKIFWHIELPTLIPFIIVILFFRLTETLREFDKIFLLTMGGPGSVTTTTSIYTYNTGFKVFRIAQTAGISWLFALLILIILIPVLFVMYKRIKMDSL